MSEVSKLIKQLSQQVNLDSISTKDLVATMSDLYNKVEQLEKDKTMYAARYEEYRILADKCQTELAAINIPLAEIETGKKKLADDQFKFTIERKYLEREVQIYSEFVRAMTSQIAKYTSSSSGNGSYVNENVSVYGPSFPSPK